MTFIIYNHQNEFKLKKTWNILTSVKSLLKKSFFSSFFNLLSKSLSHSYSFRCIYKLFSVFILNDGISYIYVLVKSSRLECKLKQKSAKEMSKLFIFNLSCYCL